MNQIVNRSHSQCFFLAKWQIIAADHKSSKTDRMNIVGRSVVTGCSMSYQWNVGDFCVSSDSSNGKAASSGAGKNLTSIKSLRVLRVLRPLKTINRVPKLKVACLSPAQFDGLC